MEYEETGQTSNFSSDIASVLAHVKANKLIVSPLIMQELEDFVKLQNERKKTTEETPGGK